MREFLDFLKHKCAYVAIGEFKPGRFGEAQRLFEKVVSTYSQGFKGAYLLQEPGTDKGIAIILWDKPEDMEANKNQIYEEVMEQMTPLFAKAPNTSFYELCSEIQPQS